MVAPRAAAADGEDAYLLMRPEVTWYSDRVVRGWIRTPEDLDAARRRRPDADWFLEVPWPSPASEDLLAALSARRVGEAVAMSETPLVRLHRLKP